MHMIKLTLCMWYHTWDIPIQLISSSLRYSLTSTDSTHRKSCSPNIQHRLHTLGIMLTKISSTDSTHWESFSPKYPAPIPHTGNHAHRFDPLSSPGSITKNVCQ